MVFHLFERIFGTYGDPRGTIRESTAVSHLVEGGFSEEEAKNLAWFNGLENRGKLYGTLLGVWTVYCMKPWWRVLQQKSPRLFYQSYWNPILKAAIIYGGYVLGDYWATSPLRRGANDQISHFYNNNEFLITREMFIHSFEPLNRKFTREEINQFFIRKGKNTGDTRKWIYNPHIHGDKADFDRELQNAASAKPAFTLPNVKAKIEEENKGKITAGEEILDKPYNLSDFIDLTGKKQGLQKLPIITGWKPLA